MGAVAVEGEARLGAQAEALKETLIRLRWRIAFLLSAAIAISYLDRQTLPVAVAAIQREIPISNTQFSQLQAAFQMQAKMPRTSLFDYLA